MNKYKKYKNNITIKYHIKYFYNIRYQLTTNLNHE